MNQKTKVWSSYFALALSVLIVLGAAFIIPLSELMFYYTKGKDGFDVDSLYPNVITRSSPEAFKKGMAKDNVLGHSTDFDSNLYSSCNLENNQIARPNLTVQTNNKQDFSLNVKGYLSKCIIDKNLFIYSGKFPVNSFSNDKYQNDFKDLTRLQVRSLDCMLIPYPNSETKTILYEIRVGEIASAPMEGYTNQFDLSCNMQLKPGFYNVQESNNSSTTLRIEVK